MGLFNMFFKSETQLEEELRGLEKAQEALDERFKKKQVSNETYKQKSMEFMLKREKIERKLNNKNN